MFVTSPLAGRPLLQSQGKHGRTHSPHHKKKTSMTFATQAPTAPQWRGIPLKYIALVTLTIQNSMLVILMRYSRTISAATGSPYITSTAVLLSEVAKCIICTLLLIEPTNPEKIIPNFIKLISIDIRQDALKLLVPAGLYTIQNNLQYVAATHLDAATFQVTYQMKIITTALFSVAMLHRSLSGLKWIALIVLTLGVAIVSLPSGSNNNKKTDIRQSQTLGLMAVTAACILSGLAGVYFEKILKGSTASVWLRNVQLGIYSVILSAIFGVWLKDGNVIAERGFFVGYDIWTLSAIACQALGGLIVAVVVKYADNILKGFSTSISILLSCILSYFIFDFTITLIFLCGSGLVVYATYLYSLPDAAVPITSPKLDSMERGSPVPSTDPKAP